MQIDTIYKTVQTILNKDQRGYISPEEFNILINNTQLEIYREYFDDHNRAQLRQNKGTVTGGYGDLVFNSSQKIEQFAAIQPLTFDTTTQSYPLPTDIYLLEKDGLTTQIGRVISEVSRADINHLARSSASPTEVYPVFEKYNKFVRVYPVTIIENVTCRYLRVPKPPRWTYIIVRGVPMFNPAATDFQDVELLDIEFSNIVMRLCSLFGVVIREAEVTQIAEVLKDKSNNNENS